MTSSRARARGPGPWIVLGLVALVPALILLAVHRWSSARTDESTAAPPIDPMVSIPTPTPALPTNLMTFRRMPTIISRELNGAAFEAEIAPFLATLNDRSCAVISVDGQEIGARNADIAVIPASNQKLLVAAVALERLGEDFTYTTTVRAAAAPVDGLVEGDLFLIGGGDPLLSSNWYPDSNLELHPVTSPTSLDALADGVVAAGVTRRRRGRR